MQNRIKRRSRNRGLSKVERLASADVFTVIESIKQSVPTAAVDLRGLSKKRKKSGEHNKAHVSKKRTKHKEPATEEAGSEADSVASDAESGSAHESAGHDTRSDLSSADLSSAVEGVVKDTQRDTDQRARVEYAPDSGTEPTDAGHEETTPQQSLAQDLPRTPRTQPKAVAGLLTPPQSRLRSTLHRLGTRSEQGTPTLSAAKPPAGTERLPKILSAPLPRASTHARPQPSREEQAASQQRPDEFLHQTLQSLETILLPMPCIEPRSSSTSLKFNSKKLTIDSAPSQQIKTK